MADPVWVLVMFDLPVATKEQRKGATRYRKLLLDDGFSMVQFSIYSKYLVNASGLRAILPWVKFNVPPGGAVRILRLTDEQWAAARVQTIRRRLNLTQAAFAKNLRIPLGTVRDWEQARREPEATLRALAK